MFMFSDEVSGNICKVVVIKSTLDHLLLQHYCICLSKLSLPILIFKPSSRVRVDRFLGKSNGLINGNAKDVGALVIGAL